jgi:hypothetical protein
MPFVPSISLAILIPFTGTSLRVQCSIRWQYRVFRFSRSVRHKNRWLRGGASLGCGGENTGISRFLDSSWYAFAAALRVYPFPLLSHCIPLPAESEPRAIRGPVILAPPGCKCCVWAVAGSACPGNAGEWWRPHRPCLSSHTFDRYWHSSHNGTGW